MKAIRFTTLMALGIALSLFTSGCHPQDLKRIPGTRTAAPEVNPMPSLPPPTFSQDTNPATMVEMSEFPGHTNWSENAEQLKSDTIHFAYDSSAVRGADKSKIADVASYLRSNPQTAVRVEGNCDERGTEEYNRSLGERRALAAREELVHLGIASDRVDTISYGEDKPADPSHTQGAWEKNRRDEFILLTPPAK
jgi:peptidoglycan-associated lipoprotein